MPYENIPGIGATYIDGAFQTFSTSGQPRVMVFGAASNGLAYEIFVVNNTSDAEAEFGSASEVMKGVHEALAQGADNIAVMRIGGRKGQVVLTDAVGGTLTITPEVRDDEALQRYALIMTKETINSVEIQRVLIRDVEAAEWVFDSLEELVLDTGLVEVIDGGLTLFEIGSIASPDTEADSPRLAKSTDNTALALDDFVPDMTGVANINGDDGLAMTQMERYAALCEAYQFLDYKDADLLLPMGAFQDTPNAADDVVGHGIPTTLSEIELLQTDKSTDKVDGLLHMWKTIYRGKPYVFFLERSDTDQDGTLEATDNFFPIPNPPGSVTFHNNGTGVVADATSAWTVTPDTVRNGPLHIDHVDSNGGDVTFTINQNTPVAGETTVVINFDYDTATVTGGIIAELANNAAATALITIADAEPGGDPSAGAINPNATTIAVIEASTLITIPVITHEQLTGDTVPTAVWDKFDAAVDAQVREVNFAHQLATVAERASTTWSTMLGVISVMEPPAYSRAAIAEWVGEEPAYSFIGNVLAVDEAADNGEGLLGNKFHAGATSYRTHLVTEGNASEGYAYGGYIKTNGASLAYDEPYGVNSNDESLDLKAKPEDLGKHLFVTASWPILSNGFDGGSQYRGTLAGTLVGKFAVTPANIEPIGLGGVLRNIRRPPRMRAPLINSLAKLRYVSTRREEGTGHLLVSVKTCAHPDSDYTRLSTIRCVNREITGLRAICMPYIGKEFNSRNLQAMQTSIDGFLKGERDAGFNQGAIAKMEYSRADKIFGRLKIRLKMIPPFSLEAITIETTLAADESELVL